MRSRLTSLLPDGRSGWRETPCRKARRASTTAASLGLVNRQIVRSNRAWPVGVEALDYAIRGMAKKVEAESAPVAYDPDSEPLNLGSLRSSIFSK